MLTKQPGVIEAVFASIPVQDVRAQAIVDFSQRLAASPPAANVADMARLRGAGLSETEILDLILSVALFGWANRLMQTLGEPIRPETAM